MVVVKLDEALSETLTPTFENHGYSVRTVGEQGWQGLKDSILWPKIQAEGAFFVTTDKGFGDLRSYRPGSHAGILVLRPTRESLVEFKRLIEEVLSRHKLEHLKGCLAVASTSGLRVRRGR